MKKISALLLAGFLSITAFAQMPGDTIVVSSLVHTSTTRDTMVSFPNLPNVSFEKIIMKYNMRCKGAQVSTSANRNLGCGEWDYSCNTFVRDSSKIDSTNHTTLNYSVPGFTGTTLDYTTTPINDYYRMIQQNVVINSTTSETQSTVGLGNSNIAHSVPTSSYGAKSQYLYTQAELTAAGAVAGNLDGLILNVNTAGVNSNFLKVKIKSTSKTQLSASAPDTSGFTELFFYNTNFAVGANRLQFHTPFAWNGTSNLIVEFSFTNAAAGASNVIFSGTATTNPMGIHSQDENLFRFNGNNYFETNNYKGISGTNARTVEAWIKTSVADKEICSWGRNAANEKWVFRVEGGGRIRVENGNGGIVGTNVLTDDKWHHVACTFNGTSLNDVKLYVDGQLETYSSNSGTPINTDAIGGINLRISRGVNNRYFDGYIDDVRIWDTDLSDITIQNWMHKKLNGTHPDAANLQLNYLINAGGGSTINDASGNSYDAIVLNGAIWQTTTGENHFKDFIEEGERPNITFIQGTYNLSVTNDTTWMAVAQVPLVVRQTSIVPHPGTLQSDEINYGPTNLYWNTLPGENYYDDTSALIQTLPVTSTGTLNINAIPYIRRYPMDFEIMSFVTPYGIGLDLGQDGKTWDFDLTDFAPLLKGDKRMFLTFGGQWQEEMDIKWLFIVGTPPADVLDINNIWRSNRSSNFSNINNDVVFPPRDIELSNDANSFKIRSTITGHGQQGEFISRNHHLDIDGGADEFSWTAWKECAANPVYPQGGTWIYDRAGWCPGMATDLQESNVDPYVTPGTTHTFDYDVDVATGDSRYIVSHQLVNYDEPNHALDARIVDIFNPSTKIEYLRENPICKDPQVVIQNVGSTTLTAVKIDFSLNNNGFMTQQWTGNLDFMEKDTVTLVTNSWFWKALNGPNGNQFHASVKAPNYGTDEYSLNDKMYSPFEITSVLPNDFKLLLKGNNAFTETKVEILDDQNNVVFSKIPSSSSITWDTIQLQDGCYSLLITDTDDDGISFWANSDGTGFLQLRDNNNSILYIPEGDFGKYTRFNFTVNVPLSYEEIHGTLNVKVFPNPADNMLHIQGDYSEQIDVEIIDALGEKVDIVFSRCANEIKINTTSLANGFYFVKMQLGNQRSVRKVFVRH